MDKHVIRKTVWTTFRIIAGIIFIFSGFVKGVDPTGSAIKFHDYLEAFHLDFLQLLTVPVAFILPLLEFITGISLLFGFKIRAGIVSFLLFMIVFTPLTFILALFNPVTDCGCFGDALVITNWQTFWKNLVLLGFALTLFTWRKQITTQIRSGYQWTALFLFAIFFLIISVHSYRYLPLIDFRPYHTGISIPEGMHIPEGAPEDEYETTLIYEKDGIRKEFTMDNFPWQDSTWTFVEQKSKRIRQGYIPPIHDFDIILPQGEDITEQILHDPGYTFLLVSYNILSADSDAMGKAFKLNLAARDQGTGFYLLTSSGTHDVENVFSRYGISFPYANTDETTLRTIIRSNPGLLLIRDGVILQKWPGKRIPEPDIMSHSLLSRSLTIEHRHLNCWFSLFTALIILGTGLGFNWIGKRISSDKSL